MKVGQIVLNESRKVNINGQSYKMQLGVNKNPTKQGIKIQFTPLTAELSSTSKADMSVSLQNHLNKALSKYGLAVDIDADVPSQDVIGFYIRLAYFDKLLKKALAGNEKETP